MIILRWLLLLVLAASGLSIAGPHEFGTQRLSLLEAEQLWQEHNRELKLAKVAVRAAEADLVVAGQAPNPQVSFNAASISPQEGFGKGGLRDKRMDSILRLEQLIERGNKRELRSQVADAQLKATRNDLDDTLRQQRQTLWAAYFDLMLAQEKRHVAADAAALYAKSLVASEMRLKVGDISGTDLSRLRIEKLRADNDARQATGDLEKAQVALAYLIGKESDARSLFAADAWQKPSTFFDQPVDFSKRPDIRAAQARVDAAERGRELARALKKRDITVGAQLERNLQNNPTNSFGLGVSTPLFVRHEYEGEIARAEADLEAARELLAQTEAQAKGSVDQARSDLLASRERRERLENELVIDAERVAKAAEFAYAKGAMSLIDLLDARRTWRQVQLETAQSRADHAKALAAWRSACGE